MEIVFKSGSCGGSNTPGSMWNKCLEYVSNGGEVNWRWTCDIEFMEEHLRYTLDEWEWREMDDIESMVEAQKKRCTDAPTSGEYVGDLDVLPLLKRFPASPFAFFKRGDKVYEVTMSIRCYLDSCSVSLKSFGM